MLDFQQAAKRAVKAAKASILSSLCNELDKVQKLSNVTVPHGIDMNIICSANTTSPTMTITLHSIRYIIAKRTCERVMEKCPSSYYRRGFFYLRSASSN